MAYTRTTFSRVSDMEDSFTEADVEYIRENIWMKTTCKILRHCNGKYYMVGYKSGDGFGNGKIKLKLAHPVKGQPGQFTLN